MLKNTYILKSMTILLITLSIIFSSVSLADTHINCLNKSINSTSDGIGASSKGPIYWDNGLNYAGLAAAQYDSTIPLDTFQADDFILTEPKEIGHVEWIGGYWGNGYLDGSFNWGISFYKDNATLFEPDGRPYTPTFAGPFIFEWGGLNKTVIEDTGTSIYYDLSIDLPQNILFSEGKYWISIWGIGQYPPRSGWGYHTEILIDPALWGSDYYSISYWTPGSEVTGFGFDFDMAFQLSRKLEADLVCDSEGLDWTEVKPGDIMSGFIYVCNYGEPGSFLDFYIDDKNPPDWGEWEFDPAGGSGIPEGDCVPVIVTCKAPRKGGPFTGEINIYNSQNESDYCVITTSMTLPKPRIFSHPVILHILEKLAEFFPILKYLFNDIFY